VNEQDKEYLRDLLAGFASVRIGMDGSKEVKLASAIRCYEFADAMLDARKPKEETGIVAVKRSPTTRRSK
jgi:hypothetical protein